MTDRREDDVFLTRTEAAALMRLNPRTLGNLAAKRQGPPYMKTSVLAGRALYRRSDVIAFLESNGRGPAERHVTAPALSPAVPRRRRKAAVS